MAISQVGLSNTFLHWLGATNQAISYLNQLESGNYTKLANTFTITSTGTAFQVTSGTSVFSAPVNIISSLTVDGSAVFQNTVTSNSYIGSGSGIVNLNANNIASGTINPARLGSGTANANTVLYGDNTWRYVKASGGNGLTSTEIKTSSYSALANELVRCDSSNGSFTITLSDTPIDGDRVGVLDVNKAFGNNAVTISPNGKTIEEDATGLILDLTGTYIEFIYNSSTSNWRINETPLGSFNYVTGDSVSTLTNKTITLANNTLSGNLAQFNAAVTDADLVSINGTETLINKTFTGYTETVYTLATSGSIVLSVANGTIQSCTLNGNPTFVDSISSGQSIVLMLNNGSSYAVTYPSITWVGPSGNTAPSLSAGNVLVLWKVSTTLYGASVGKYA